ncbi:MAG: sulfotransferase, partial [Aquificae bacterium]|nr:sulfotransferase [Aquificota bacterium]
MKKRIFIGGTGRSGTTILYDLLRTHKEIYAFPLEMRFIIDPDGILNLVDTLTYQYSIPQARESLYRFEKLMKEYLTKASYPPYIGFNFEKMFGKDFYYNQLTAFLSKLVIAEFYGSDYPIKTNCLSYQLSPIFRFLDKSKISKIFIRILKLERKHLWPHRKIKEGKFFENREELIKLCADFIDNLFFKVTYEHGKSIWCEKTPSNLLHLDFIYELYPDAFFIHIKRDPRGVIFSMKNQFWMSKNLEKLCLTMKQLYKKFFYLKKKINLQNYKYLEIKIEDLAKDYESNLEKITSFLEIDKEFVNP